MSDELEEYKTPDQLTHEEYELLCGRFDELINSYPEKGSEEYNEMLTLHFILEEYQIGLSKKFRSLCLSLVAILFALFSLLFAYITHKH
jgi:hypothetical protein